MQIIGLAKKVTVYIGESDRWGRKPLHLAILEMLKQEDCAEATVTRALAGFGAQSRIHSAQTCHGCRTERDSTNADRAHTGRSSCRPSPAAAHGPRRDDASPGMRSS